jgi:hypothetical protein
MHSRSSSSSRRVSSRSHKSKCQRKCQFKNILNVLNDNEKSILNDYKKLYMCSMECAELPLLYTYKCMSSQYDKIFLYNQDIERIFHKISKYESIGESIICILKECLNLQSNPFQLYLASLKELILSKNLSGLKTFLKHYKKIIMDNFAIHFPNTPKGTEPTINNLDAILEKHTYTTEALYYMNRVKLQRIIQNLYFHTKLLPMFIYKIANVLGTILQRVNK